MSVFQIIAISILGLGALTAIVFAVAFIVVSLQKEKKEEHKEQEVVDDEVNEIDLDAMLKKLEEVSTKKEEIKEPEEVVEEQEVKDETQEQTAIEEVVEEPEEVIVKDNEEEKEEPEIEVEPIITVVNNENIEKSGPEFDYRVRLEKIKESQAKIDRDLDKTTRAILKYERTIRRKDRNQKMLDRRAHELTNLNLLMYSVTDIKNVDAEKKTRQEELTKHIAELKASIQDAENYLEINKEKHENNIRLSEYLTHEKTRYAEEVKELEEAIASGKYFDDNTGDNK